MARKFAELEAKMSSDAIARSDEQYRKMVAEMALHELRRGEEYLSKSLPTR